VYYVLGEVGKVSGVLRVRVENARWVLNGLGVIKAVGIFLGVGVL
jgi:hypothetical protein